MINIMNKFKSTLRRTKYIAAFTLMFVGLTPGRVSAAPCSSATATFSLEPASISVNVGSTQDINLYVTPSGAALAGAQADVSFPSNLQYQSFDSTGNTFGSVLVTSGGTAGSPKVSVANFGVQTTSPSGTKVYIGKFHVNAATAGSGSVTLGNLAAGDGQTPSVCMNVVAQNASFTVTTPTNPTCSAGQTGTYPNCVTPPTPTTTHRTVVTVPKQQDPKQTENVPLDDLTSQQANKLTTPLSLPVAKKTKSSSLASKIVTGAVVVAGLGMLGVLASYLVTFAKRRQSMASHGLLSYDADAAPKEPETPSVDNANPEAGGVIKPENDTSSTDESL